LLLIQQICRAYSIGGEFLSPSDQIVEDEDEGTLCQEQGYISGGDLPGDSHASCPISYDLVQILASIRSLTISQGTSKTLVPLDKTDDFLAACFRIQQQLGFVKSKTAGNTMEESCLHAAILYIDMILLEKPWDVVIRSAENGQLQEAMSQSRSARDLKENKDILDWVSTIAALSVFCPTSSHRAGAVDKFDAIVMRLERFYMT
jgi:hypothetical protein